jgi:hypothetical protein
MIIRVKSTDEDAVKAAEMLGSRIEQTVPKN